MGEKGADVLGTEVGGVAQLTEEYIDGLFTTDKFCCNRSVPHSDGVRDAAMLRA